ncbi:winged helix-turn-helix domain-containing protein [Halosimplex halobium]|uniref:winged helix-turn-helix domain-containing protein n=1 Tax=Halosimplex halobium TaxID=3396618 RepID=UPI003F546A7D
MADGGDSGEQRPGADERGDGIVERVSAEGAFELLGNETRLATVRALFEADDPLSFSALRDAVGVRDSGQFNYHLDKLRGSFVRETDEGYALTAAGTHVVGSVLAGHYTKTVAGDPVPVDADCPYCEGSLAALFDEEYVRIACSDCDRNVISLTVPPGAFEDHPREEWPVVAERWTRRTFERYQRGFCGVCHGPVDPHLELDPPDVHDVYDAGVRYACRRCGDDMFANVEATVLSHPAVVAFYYERGIDVAETPIWAFDWAVQPTASVVAEDPPRVEVPVEHEGDRLVLTLDEAADVVAERRA